MNEQEKGGHLPADDFGVDFAVDVFAVDLDDADDDDEEEVAW